MAVSHDGVPTFDIDHHEPDWQISRPEPWAVFREDYPVALNSHYGGFWMVSDYESVATVMRDATGYAHKFEMGGPEGIDLHGVAGIPRHKDLPRMGLSEDDGVRHNELRRLLNVLFAPRVIEPERAMMRATARWFLDQSIASGAMDLVLDYTNPVPAVITLRRMGLPVENWRTWAHTIHGLLGFPEGSKEQAEASRAVVGLKQEMVDAALQRRGHPTQDVTSVVANLRCEGELLTEDQLRSVMWTLTVGGLNTTTGLVGKALCFLSANPDHRRTLIEQPELIGSAVEEFLRFYSITQSMSRTVLKDAELGGCPVRRGDRMMINVLSANHDEAVFERADEIVLDREENRHLAFGLGPHRCIGSHVGRIMAQEMLLEVLERIPDFTVAADEIVEFSGWPNLGGLLCAPATFTPATPAGSPKPF
jgi:cytochrome P450